MSEWTPGQAEYIDPMLNTCVEARSALKSDTAKKWVMLETDVVKVLRDLIKRVKDEVSKFPSLLLTSSSCILPLLVLVTA